MSLVHFYVNYIHKWIFERKIPHTSIAARVFGISFLEMTICSLLFQQYPEPGYISYFFLWHAEPIASRQRQHWRNQSNTRIETHPKSLCWGLTSFMQYSFNLYLFVLLLLIESGRQPCDLGFSNQTTKTFCIPICEFFKGFSWFLRPHSLFYIKELPKLTHQTNP